MKYFFKNDWRNTEMLNVKLQYLCSLNQEILRLEKIKAQMQKNRDYEKRDEFYKDLNWCKEERKKIIKENPLKDVELTEEEKVMASFYYYEGKTWELAFDEMVSQLELTIYDKYSDDELIRCVNRLSKYIVRKIEKYNNYYKKGK